MNMQMSEFWVQNLYATCLNMGFKYMLIPLTVNKTVHVNTMTSSTFITVR